METTLYKRNKAGKVLLWTINHNETSYWTTTGQIDGKMTTTLPTVCEAKNVGRSNETTVAQQVELEVASKIKYQLEHGYSSDIPSEEKPFDVSLAAKYVDRQEANKLEFPYIMQPKLDGIRCYIKKDDDGVIRMRSRAHKEFVSCPHIVNDKIVKEVFNEYPNVILDGELYNHQLKQNFNKIVSLVRKTKPLQEDLEESENLIYFACFDCFFKDEQCLTYQERNKRLVNLARSCWKPGDNQENVIKFGRSCHILFVSSIGVTGALLYNNEIATNEAEVEDKINVYINLGYEGIMLKRDAPYFFGRSTDLLKYKKFKDEEFEIIDVEDGKGNKAGIGVNVICKSNNGDTTFKAGINGTEEYATDMFVNKSKFIGKMCTVKYQELTPIKSDGTGGVPRFGKMVSVRDYE